jgi:hypothetical protein
VTLQPLVYLFVARAAPQFFAQAARGDLAPVARGVFERVAAGGLLLLIRLAGSRP